MAKTAFQRVIPSHGIHVLYSESRFFLSECNKRLREISILGTTAGQPFAESGCRKPILTILTLKRKSGVNDMCNGWYGITYTLRVSRIYSLRVDMYM